MDRSYNVELFDWWIDRAIEEDRSTIKKTVVGKFKDRELVAEDMGSMMLGLSRIRYVEIEIEPDCHIVRGFLVTK